MNAAPRPIPANLTPAQWVARLVSLPVVGLGLFLLLAILTNTEDVTPAAIPFLLAIGIALICILVAWRWGYRGGIALVISSLIVWLTYRYLTASIDPEAPFLALPSGLDLTLFASGSLFVLAHRQPQ